MKKKLLLIIIVLFVFVVILLFINHTKQRDIVAIVNDKTYSIYQFQKKYDVKVLNFNSKRVKVSNGETYYTCYYYHVCEIWPNSKGGMIMYEAPLVYVKFKKLLK